MNDNNSTSLKVLKANACDDADVAEQKTKLAKVRAEKATAEAEELITKAQKLEVDLEKSNEELNIISEKLKEKDEALNTAELEVANLNRCFTNSQGALTLLENSRLDLKLSDFPKVKQEFVSELTQGQLWAP